MQWGTRAAWALLVAIPTLNLPPVTDAKRKPRLGRGFTCPKLGCYLANSHLGNEAGPILSSVSCLCI